MLVRSCLVFLVLQTEIGLSDDESLNIFNLTARRSTAKNIVQQNAKDDVHHSSHIHRFDKKKKMKKGENEFVHSANFAAFTNLPTRIFICEITL